VLLQIKSVLNLEKRGSLFEKGRLTSFDFNPKFLLLKQNLAKPFFEKTGEIEREMRLGRFWPVESRIKLSLFDSLVAYFLFLANLKILFHFNLIINLIHF